MKKKLLKDYCDQGLSAYDIARRENKSQTTIVYWLKKHELKTNPNWYWKEEELRAAIKSSSSIHSCLLLMGKNTSSGSYNSFRRNVLKYGIDVSHLDGRKSPKRRITNFALFINDSTVSRSVVKKRLISDKIISYKCFKCGNDGYWNNVKLVLVLDHENGIRNDHRIENLRFVCPNCNSQLPTHCVGNKDV